MDATTTNYFALLHDIDPPVKINTYPRVDFLVSTHPTNQSLNTQSLNDDKTFYM